MTIVKINKKLNNNKERKKYIFHAASINGTGKEYWSFAQFYGLTFGKEGTTRLPHSNAKHSDGFCRSTHEIIWSFQLSAMLT